MPMIEPIAVRSLSELVYEYLRKQLSEGQLQPGAFIDVNTLSAALQVSKTPLRDALLQLAGEGFIEVLPRRGFVVHKLTLSDIRHLYQMIGALESAAFAEAAVKGSINGQTAAALRSLNDGMRTAVENNHLTHYYALNCTFHTSYIHLSDNKDLIRLTDIYRQRLYDFPYRRDFLTDWERRSCSEHDAFIALIEKGDLKGAADHIREVHWSYDVQEDYILYFYHDAVDNPEGTIQTV